MSSRSGRTDGARSRGRPHGGSVVALPKDRAPASAGVAWLALALAILACLFSAIAMVRAGDAREAARSAAFDTVGTSPEVAGDEAG